MKQKGERNLVVDLEPDRPKLELSLPLVIPVKGAQILPGGELLL